MVRFCFITLVRFSVTGSSVQHSGIGAPHAPDVPAAESLRGRPLAWSIPASSPASRTVAAVVRTDGAGGREADRQCCLLAGTPQVVVPIYDQHSWAGRVHRLGNGVDDAAGVPTPHSPTGALEWIRKPPAAAGTASHPAPR